VGFCIGEWLLWFGFSVWLVGDLCFFLLYNYGFFDFPGM
jgi:hypothetical protein